MSQKRYPLHLAAFTCLYLFLSWFLLAQDFVISAQVVNPHTIRFDFNTPAGLRNSEIILFRSTAELTGPKINKIRHPVAEFRINSTQNPTAFYDRYAANNVTYNYLAVIQQQNQEGIFAASNTIRVSIPDVTIEELEDPIILVNKRYYYLEIQNKGKTAKRYPMTLGRDPFKRKLHQDNKTTPEGPYKIINLQTKATFYKAIDIDYPNALDGIRYDFMKEEGLIPDGRGIGGEIQIHGQAPSWGSIHRNWTWGCISLRNSDMDEILNLPSIKIGIPVLIFGHEFSQKDKNILEEERSVDDVKAVQTILTEMGFYDGKIDGVLGKQTQFAIGRYQKDQGIPITCVLDSRTLELFMKLP